MKRVAFQMKLKKGFEAEYKKRHDAIWPDLSRLLKESGISDYSIFLDESTSTLFAVQKLGENNSAETLPSSPVLRKWWEYMADIMETNADNSPVVVSLTEVFHLD